MSEQLRSLRHERDVREHGDAVTTRPWWNAPGEESGVRYWPDVEASLFDPNTMTEVKLERPGYCVSPSDAKISITAFGDPVVSPGYKPIRILANPRPFT